MRIGIRKILGHLTALSLAALAGKVAVAQQPPALPVVVAEVVERELPATIKLVGTVRANRQAVVAAEVDGLVGEFAAGEGEFLASGAVICQLDATPAKLRAAEARARLGSLQAKLDELEKGTREELVRQLAAQVEEAEAILEKWEFERKRVNELFERNQSSSKERHDTEMEYLAAKQRLSQYKAAHEIAVNGPRIEEIDRARYDLAAQQAVVQRLERDLEKTQICAPFDGFVVAKRTEVGEWIDAGGAVCEMVAIETVKVRADVPESAVPFAQVGMPVSVYFQALDKTYNATVSRLIPRASVAARTFPIEIDLRNENHALLVGMFAWAYVPAGPSGKRLMVPKDAIVSRGVQKQVFVIRPGQGGGQMAIPTPVTTGLEIEGEIEIQASGVNAGDLVVTRANERLYGPTPVTLSRSQAGKELSRGSAAENSAQRPEPSPQQAASPAQE